MDSPCIHILEGEKVNIHVIIPAQFSAAFASSKRRRIICGETAIGFKIIEP
jgi:hypothetical protein